MFNALRVLFIRNHYTLLVVRVRDTKTAVTRTVVATTTSAKKVKSIFRSIAKCVRMLRNSE